MDLGGINVAIRKILLLFHIYSNNFIFCRGYFVIFGKEII